MNTTLIESTTTNAPPPRTAATGEAVRVPSAREMYVDAPRVSIAEQEARERAFFAALRLQNGTYKFTHARRMDDLNRAVLDLLPPARPLRLMDTAVSSGISTLEWTESLERENIEYRMTAGDLTAWAYLISDGAQRHALVDANGYPLQFEVRGNVAPNPPGGRFTVRHPLALRLLRAVVREHFAALKNRADNANDGEVTHGDARCRRLALVSPRVIEAAHLEIVEDDILRHTHYEKKFHVVRAANILNRSYFDDATLAQMLDNLRGRVTDDGLLIVCRADERAVNHATVFRLNERRRCEPLARLGDGSEIEDLARSLPAVA